MFWLCGTEMNGFFVVESLPSVFCFILYSDNTATSFLSTYTCPEPQIPVSHALLCTITGLLLPEDIYKLLQELRYVLHSATSCADHNVQSMVMYVLFVFTRPNLQDECCEYYLIKMLSGNILPLKY